MPGKFRTACLAIKAVREFMEEEQGKHFCKCGCGGEIIINPEQYYMGIPNYKRGHWRKNTLDIATKKFWGKVDKTDGCWKWTGGSDDNNQYGVIRVCGESHSPHRFSYKINVGEIPEGMHVLHHCDDPLCVRPEHLFLGCHQDNMIDRTLKGRSRKKLSMEDTRKVVEMLKLGKTSKEIAKLFGVTRMAIEHIKVGKTWSWLTGIGKES